MLFLIKNKTNKALLNRLVFIPNELRIDNLLLFYLFKNYNI